MLPRTSIQESTYEYQEPVIEKIGPVLVKAAAITSGAAILIPAVIALIGPFIG